MELRCPNCQAPVYSRKQKICGVCEKPLPKEFWMSDTEIKFWKQEMDKEEKHAKDFEKQVGDLGPHEHPGGLGGPLV